MFIHLLRDIGGFLVRMEDSDLFIFLKPSSIVFSLSFPIIGDLHYE